ncbi:type IV pilus twitching motility protein PilT [Myxococcota bacterium]|nr:type IV pilus twitching motility protein PilT [Myxococcota bacterium]
MLSLPLLLRAMIDRSASDLHITVDAPPRLRIDGRLVPVRGEPLSPSETKDLCYSILTDAQKQRFDEQKELDLSFDIRGMARFRANVFVQKRAVAGVFRRIPYEIPSIDSLGLPPVVRDLAGRPRGLVLVTGPTGSGKSTTLASMVDLVNQGRNAHIITVEDPIEYVHVHKKSLVNQREIGADTESFAGALKFVLRQDPDVVLIGELRDLETIEAALRVSETGHLVLASLHTNSAIQTINRIVDVFPAYHQPRVRVQLSFVLEGVVCQQLLPRAGGAGRVLACEVLILSPAIRAQIRDDKLHQVYSQMQMGQARSGMMTMNQSLAQLIQKGEVTLESALACSSDPEELRSLARKS